MTLDGSVPGLRLSADGRYWETSMLGELVSVPVAICEACHRSAIPNHYCKATT